ncbi:MAG TPA: SUMF1/EgtB/PvdO family nonheme iron enzyme [Saprospiraceae bacterium]|nr:SUMF1/EgtB/PvdO family nonheme iron enzyme [Saprospiraceae bacterium]
MTQPVLSPFTEHLPGGITFDMLPVEGGEFFMGGADEEAMKREKPVHRVKVSFFFLGKYPVTQAV